MKKILVIIISVCLIMGIGGCKKNTDDNVLSSDNNVNEGENMKKNLVLYFSATKTTKKVAEVIADVTKGDIVEIVPKNKYTTDDLNYNGDCRANREQNDNSSRPEIKNKIDIDGYERIFIGYPIWWGTNPRIILTLLDNYNFDGKNILLFCTSGSSGIEQSITDIKTYNPKMNVLGGKRFSSSVSKREVELWISEY